MGASPEPLRMQTTFVEPHDAIENLDLGAWTVMVQEAVDEASASGASPVTPARLSTRVVGHSASIC